MLASSRRVMNFFVVELHNRERDVTCVHFVQHASESTAGTTTSTQTRPQLVLHRSLLACLCLFKFMNLSLSLSLARVYFIDFGKIHSGCVQTFISRDHDSFFYIYFRNYHFVFSKKIIDFFPLTKGNASNVWFVYFFFFQYFFY